jgi:hypothetical protein
MKKIRPSTMRAKKTTPVRAPAVLERMTPEEREATIAVIEREITIKGSQISPATLRFSVGNLGLEFAGWFIKNLPMRDDRALAVAKKYGFPREEDVPALVRELREAFVMPYTARAMELFVASLPNALRDAIWAQFLVAASEAIDSLQGLQGEGPLGPITFPRANRARLRSDVRKVFERQFHRRFPGKHGTPRDAALPWKAEERLAFCDIVECVCALAAQIKKFESVADLRQDANFRASDEGTRAAAEELFSIYNSTKTKEGKRPRHLACVFAARQLQRDLRPSGKSFASGYLVRLYHSFAAMRIDSAEE